MNGTPSDCDEGKRMTLRRANSRSWRIETNKGTITSLETWKEFAPPKSDAHWKPGRSAFECASTWFDQNGTPSVPTELAALLESSRVTEGAQIVRVQPEHRVRFDRLRGEPRNADVNVLLDGPAGRVALSIEAKADEPFGARVVDVLQAAVAKIAADTPTNAVLRVQQLASALFDKSKLARPPLGEMRYQLLTGIAGALAFANEVEAPCAMFVVHEFVTDSTEDKSHLQNLRDLNALVERLTDGHLSGIPCGRMVGPIHYPGAPLFASGQRPALYLAKARRVTRSSDSLGVFGVNHRLLEASCTPVPLGQNWRDMFDSVRPLARGEGGGIYLADNADGCFVVTSESALGELLDDGEPTEFLHRFESGMAREVWCNERFCQMATERG